MKMSKLVLSEEAMWLLFHLINSSHSNDIAWRVAHATLKEQNQSTGRELFGNHGLHMEILDGLINTNEFEDGEEDGN